jgi:hypothetical protein
MLRETIQHEVQNKYEMQTTSAFIQSLYHFFMSFIC